MLIDWLENTDTIVNIIKTFFIITYAYYTNIRLLNLKKKYKLLENFGILICLLCISVVARLIRDIDSISSSIMFLIFILSIIFCVQTKNKFGCSILTNSISISINYALFFIASSISFIPCKIIGIENRFLNLLLIIIFYTIMIKSLYKMRKLKNGFSYLKNNRKNELLNLLILDISIILMLSIVIICNSNKIVIRSVMIVLIISVILMFITIQKSLQLYYKQRMLVKDLEETKKELEEKKAEVKELEKENLNFSKISHTIAHRQKSLEHKLEELNMNNEISSELGARIENVTKDLKKETPIELSKTGISVIDDMLSYMQSECVKNKIDFQLQLNGNIYTMTNHYIGKDELEILLADHIKDAIIAIGYADTVNKSILVRLGKIDGIYALYIYDSGIEFEIDTFMELGIKPSTTHKDNGGTGMGFMNTFDTLRKYKASLEIEEIGKPCKDNFTKVLKFRFDNKNEFKIKSYRKDEIKKKDKENKLNLV